MSRTAYHRLGVAVAVGAALFLVLGIGALGIIGEGGENDRMFLAVLAVLAIGTIVARLRSRAMAVALLATSLAQVLVGVVAVARGLHDEPGASVGDIVMLTAMYAGLFAVSAWFFRAAEQDVPVLVGSRR